MQCANPPNHPTCVPLNCSHAVLLHCHAVSTNLILLTMLTTSIALVNAAALAVACAVIHAAVIVMMMIAIASVPLVFIIVIHLLGIMIFSPRVRPSRWNPLTMTFTNVDTLVAILPNVISHNGLIFQILHKELVSPPSGYSDTSIPFWRC